MRQQLLDDMEELSVILKKALDDTLRDTRTRSGMNIFDINNREVEVCKIAEDRMIEAGLVDNSYIGHLQSELSVYFSMDYDDGGNFSIGYNCDEFIDIAMELSDKAMKNPNIPKDKIWDEYYDEDGSSLFIEEDAKEARKERQSVIDNFEGRE